MTGFCRTTLFKALRRPDGRVVCIDIDHLPRTTKVVASQGDYDLALSLGWSTHPETALALFEREEETVSDAAAVRAFEDRNMSESALAEAEIAESGTIRHLPAIPEGPKRRVHRKKVIGSGG